MKKLDLYRASAEALYAQLIKSTPHSRACEFVAKIFESRYNKDHEDDDRQGLLLVSEEYRSKK